MSKQKFKLPTKSDLKGRSSTISNAFAISITPWIKPTDREIEEFYKKLKIEKGKCAYCLGKGNSMDHLKPLVAKGLPTGYITNINNLVPCCSACNSSKGNKDFCEWYLSAKNKERLLKEGLTNEQIAERYSIIMDFIKEVENPLNYEEILGEELWNEYLRRKTKMLQELKENQEFCNKLSAIISKKI